MTPIKAKLHDILGLTLPVMLASGSPRRKHLLEQVGLSFVQYTPDVDEAALSTSLPPVDYVKQLATAKALAGAAHCTVPTIVIGSDTVVVIDDRILNKPVDADEAIAMLERLSGRTHVVHTGVALAIAKTNYVTAEVRSTRVTFRNLDRHEIEQYVQSGSPLDKAGAYGIQDDFGALFVSAIEGCYYTIVGLPLEMLYGMLKKISSIDAYEAVHE